MCGRSWPCCPSLTAAERMPVVRAVNREAAGVLSAVEVLADGGEDRVEHLFRKTAGVRVVARAVVAVVQHDLSVRAGEDVAAAMSEDGGGRTSPKRTHRAVVCDA